MFDMQKMSTAELRAFVSRPFTSQMERSLQQSAREILAQREKEAKA